VRRQSLIIGISFIQESRWLIPEVTVEVLVVIGVEARDERMVI